MNQSEFKPFSAMLSDVADYYRQPLKPGAIQIYWNALQRYDLAIVRRLLDEHVKASKFMPTVAEILDRVRTADGRPEPEEAWALMPRNESVSVVWTEEMAEAFAVASPLLELGDKIAARMAFLERYKTLLRFARDAGKPVKWTPSLGHDPMGRESVLLEAARLGRLSQDHVAGLLPHHEAPLPEVLPLIPDLSANGKRRSLKEALEAARAKGASA